VVSFKNPTNLLLTPGLEIAVSLAVLIVTSQDPGIEHDHLLQFDVGFPSALFDVTARVVRMSCLR